MQRQGDDAGIGPLRMNSPGRTPPHRRQRSISCSFIAPRRRTTAQIEADRSNHMLNFPLAATAGQEAMQRRASPQQTAPELKPPEQQQGRHADFQLPLATKAGRKTKSSTPHHAASALPLATTAGRKRFHLVAHLQTKEIKSHQFILEGDGVASSPASLRPEELKERKKPPYNAMDPAAEIQSTAPATGQTPKHRHRAKQQEENN